MKVVTVGNGKLDVFHSIVVVLLTTWKWAWGFEISLNIPISGRID